MQAKGRMKVMKSPNDPIANRIHDLSVCNAVPEETAPVGIPQNKLTDGNEIRNVKEA